MHSCVREKKQTNDIVPVILFTKYQVDASSHPGLLTRGNHRRGGGRKKKDVAEIHPRKWDTCTKDYTTAVVPHIADLHYLSFHLYQQCMYVREGKGGEGGARSYLDKVLHLVQQQWHMLEAKRC